MLNIPIFLASDNRYAPFVATTIASICDNTDCFCSFYVLDGGISETAKLTIKSLNRKYPNFSVNFLTIDEEAEFSDIDYQNNAGYISISTYNRFLISKLKPDLKKVLYLDVDVIVKGDIKELFSIQLENYPLAAVPESFLDGATLKDLRNNLNLSKDHRYFNAGVLLIDNEYWAKNDILSQVFKTEQKFRSKLKWADQDILNIIFNNNYKVLPPKFNDMTQFKNQNHNVLIRHFNTGLKPWELDPNEVSHFVEDVPLFWQYAQKTPFYDLLRAQKEHTQKRRIYKIFGFLPFLKEVSLAAHKKKWYLFGFLLILKVNTLVEKPKKK